MSLSYIALLAKMKLSLLVSSTEIPKQFDYNARLVKFGNRAVYIGGSSKWLGQQTLTLLVGVQISHPQPYGAIVKW